MEEESFDQWIRNYPVLFLCQLPNECRYSYTVFDCAFLSDWPVHRTDCNYCRFVFYKRLIRNPEKK